MQKDLLELFKKNSEKMIEELEKGKDIIIKKNKDNYIFYSNMIKKLK
jgi:hypothetical protein